MTKYFLKKATTKILTQAKKPARKPHFQLLTIKFTVVHTVNTAFTFTKNYTAPFDTCSSISFARLYTSVVVPRNVCRSDLKAVVSVLPGYAYFPHLLWCQGKDKEFFLVVPLSSSCS